MGESRFRLFDQSGGYLRDIRLPIMGTAEGMWGQWDQSEAFFTFNSLTHPPTVYRYDIESGSQEIWATCGVSFDASQVDSTKVWYPSKDATMVPMVLFHKRGLRPCGNHPTLLTAYGGFGVSLAPEFSARATLWVERGGVFARAAIRGGGDFGQEWHRAGRLDRRQNAFDDFIAAGEWLISNGYTKSSRLAMFGNSNGGLLVGAVMTQRPDLFRAVVCSYPLLDMLRYHKFGLSRLWLSEYGTADDPDQFRFLYGYSPYHKVVPGVEYPSVLFITGDSDTRVPPFHAFKMFAAMKQCNPSGQPLLLRYIAGGGHAPGGALSKKIEEMTDEMTFWFWQLGVS
jgi:prolyl oligopeptidase